MNKKGQALIEFVLLLPIFLMLICVLIDFSRVLYAKNHLEGVLNDTVTMYQNNTSANEINKAINDKEYTINFLKDKDNMIITLSSKVSLITPFANAFLDDPVIIKSSRVVLYEQ